MQQRVLAVVRADVVVGGAHLTTSGTFAFEAFAFSEGYGYRKAARRKAGDSVAPYTSQVLFPSLCSLFSFVTE